MQLAQCSVCHASIRADSPSCPLCGTERVPDAAAPAPSPSPPPYTPPQQPDAAPSAPTLSPAPAWGTPGYTDAHTRPADAASPQTAPYGTTAPTSGAAPARRGRGRLIVALLVVAAIAGGAAWFLTREDDATSAGLNDTWEQRTSPSGKYQIEFPVGSKPAQRSVEFASMVFDLRSIFVGDGGLERAEIGTVFVETDLASHGLTTAAIEGDLGTTLLASGARAAFDSLGIEWGESEPADSPLGTGLRLSGTVPDRDLVVRVFAQIDGTTLVGMVAIVPTAEATDADRTIDRIVGSMKVAG